MNIRRVTGIVAASAIAALVALPALASAGSSDPAPAAVGGLDGIGYICWDQYGSPLPQDEPTCSEGWQGSAPENPVPAADPSEGAPIPTSATSPAAPVPAASPAAPAGDGNGNICWDEYGYPMPQDEADCPSGWTGAPPEDPTPTGDPSEGFVP